MNYLKQLDSIQNTYSNLWKGLIGKHFSFINKYSNWSKYPRKIKKFMKKRGIWNKRKLPFVDISEINVEIQNLGAETGRIQWK